MNRSRFGFLFALLLLVGLFVASYHLVVYEWVWMHERAHVRINSMHGVDSTASVWFVGGGLPFHGLTTNNTPINIPRTELESARSLHSQNEIVGYNQLGVIQAVFLSALLVCGTLLFTRRGNPE